MFDAEAAWHFRVFIKTTRPGSAGFAGARDLCSTDAYLQMMVIAILPLCIAIGNLHTLHSDKTSLSEAWMHSH